MQFTCQVKSDGSLSLHIGAHEGKHGAWWSQLQLEIYGQGRNDMSAHWKGRSVPVTMQGAAASFVLADDGNGIDIDITQR
jgi:hypothetical protein